MAYKAYITEVERATGLCQFTAQWNLRKLEEAGLVVSKKIPSLDKMTIYFYLPVANRKFAELVLKQYYWHVGYKLGHYVPYEPITATELKEDERFSKACDKYGLTLDVGIEIVSKCPKIDTEKRWNDLILRRNVEGYIPPPKEEEAETEAVEFGVE